MTFLAAAKLWIESHNFRVHHVKEHVKSFLFSHYTCDFHEEMSACALKPFFKRYIFEIESEKQIRKYILDLPQTLTQCCLGHHHHLSDDTKMS
jgi:hypothetical protein